MPEKGDDPDPGGTGDMVAFVFGLISSASSPSSFLRPFFGPLLLLGGAAVGVFFLPPFASRRLAEPVEVAAGGRGGGGLLPIPILALALVEAPPSSSPSSWSAYRIPPAHAVVASSLPADDDGVLDLVLGRFADRPPPPATADDDDDDPPRSTA